MTERKTKNLLGSGVGNSSFGVERSAKGIVGERGDDTSWWILFVAIVIVHVYALVVRLGSREHWVLLGWVCKVLGFFGSSSGSVGLWLV